MQSQKVWSVLGAALIAVGLLGMPGPAQAQAPFVAKVQMYEVAEHIKFLDGEMNFMNFERRFANAALLGDHIVGFVEPFTGAMFADARASSFVSAKTGQGPIVGTFNILENFLGPTTTLLSTLQVKAQGKITGTLDLSTVMTTATAPVSGKWRLEKSDLHGRFQGTFAVPIRNSASPTGYVYINVDPTTTTPCRTDLGPETGAAIPVSSTVSVCPVHPKEFLLGFPLTKLVLFLFADSADSD